MVNYCHWKSVVCPNPANGGALEWTGFVFRAADLRLQQSRKEGIRRVKEMKKRAQEDIHSRISTKPEV
eukprot:9473806-Pyramimonas_sp.AAC.2